MIPFFLLLMLQLLHIDFRASAITLPADSQQQIIEYLVQKPGVPISHISVSPPPVRSSVFLFPNIPISASSGIVIDEGSGAILWQRNISAERPIASLTKLTTALVFLETDPDFNKVMTYEVSDNADASSSMLQVKPGETLTVNDLFNVALVGSANNATNALVRSTGLSREEFVSRMNAKAAKLGLRHTVFHEVTGLDPTNTSTVQDYSRLASYAFRNERIAQALNLTEYTFSTINTNHFHRVRNTDKLLIDRSINLIGAKTGYLDEAGYTFAAESLESGHRLILVLFNCSSSQARFDEAKSLLRWAYDSHQWM